MSKSAFYDPSLTSIGGLGGNLTSFLDSPHMVSYLLPSNTMYDSKCNTLEDNRGVHRNFKLSGWYL